MPIILSHQCMAIGKSLILHNEGSLYEIIHHCLDLTRKASIKRNVQ